MIRSPFAAAVVALSGIAVPALVAAQTAGQNPQAESLNDQGKELYKNKDYAGAAGKFREAIALSPDARYYFNLCATLEKAGDLSSALDACDQVYSHEPTEELKAKCGQRSAAIRQAIRDRDAGGGQTGTPPDGGQTGIGQPGDPQNPNQTGGATTGYTPGPPEGGVTQPGPELPYKWGLGISVGPEAAPGFAEGSGASTPTGLGLHLEADRLLIPSSNLGGRGFINLGFLSSDETDAVTQFEIGVAAYLHLRLFGSLYLTPALNVKIMGANVSAIDQSFAGFGAGADLALEYWMGKRGALSAGVSFSGYGTLENTDTGDTIDGGRTLAVLIGYKLHLSTEIPGLSIVTLE